MRFQETPSRRQICLIYTRWSFLEISETTLQDKSREGETNIRFDRKILPANPCRCCDAVGLVSFLSISSRGGREVREGAGMDKCMRQVQSLDAFIWAVARGICETDLRLRLIYQVVPGYASRSEPSRDAIVVVSDAWTARTRPSCVAITLLPLRLFVWLVLCLLRFYHARTRVWSMSQESAPAKAWSSDFGASNMCMSLTIPRFIWALYFTENISNFCPNIRRPEFAENLSTSDTK